MNRQHSPSPGSSWSIPPPHAAKLGPQAPPPHAAKLGPVAQARPQHAAKLGPQAPPPHAAKLGPVAQARPAHAAQPRLVAPPRTLQRAQAPIQQVQGPLPEGIYFRGDGRPVATVFKDGFASKAPNADIEYRRMNELNVGDVTPETAVCMAQTLHGATLFPLKFLSSQKDLAEMNQRIFVFYNDPKGIFDTLSLQQKAALEILAKAKDGDEEVLNKTPNALFGMLSASEAAVKSVAPEAVLGCIHAERKVPRTWQFGGTFEVKSFEINADCSSGLQTYASLVEQYAQSLVGKTEKVPAQADGAAAARRLWKATYGNDPWPWAKTK